MNRTLIVALVSSFTLGLAANTAVPVRTTRTVKGKIFEKGKRDKALFDIVETDTYEDKKLVAVHRVYSSAESGEAVVEEAKLDGSRLLSFAVEQKQLGEAGRVEVDGKRVKFAYGKKGKLETDDESLTENLVASVNLMPYLEMHREKLISGKEVNVRFVVMDRKETIGFDFEKVEERKENGKDLIVLKMSASSFLIAAIVDPLKFVVEKDTFRLLEMTGRAMPSKKEGEGWTTFDADHVYFYE